MFSQIEIYYDKLKYGSTYIVSEIKPLLRRLIKYFALPLCVLEIALYKDKTVSTITAIKDVTFIFFKLKYYPDNYIPCRLWEKKRDIWYLYYGSIYDAYQRKKLKKEVQKEEYEIVFLDKSICYSMCRAYNLPLPKQFGCVENTNECIKLVKEIFSKKSKIKLILKPVLGKGGKNINVCYKSGDEIFFKESNNIVELSNYKLKEKSVVQEFIKQHKCISRISESTNTIRIVTLYTKNKRVLIIGAYIRFGRGDSYIDNVSSGGISAGINLNSGYVNNIAFDKNGKIFKKHPETNIQFNDIQIPFWEDVLKLARKIQIYFSFYKLLGHDIAITENGPIVIEINEAHDNIALEQRCGPLFSNEDVKREFMRYNLLINKYSKFLA